MVFITGQVVQINQVKQLILKSENGFRLLLGSWEWPLKAAAK